MIITTTNQLKFKKQILKDYYLESEKQGRASLLRNKSLNNLDSIDFEKKSLRIDENYLTACMEYEKALDEEHTLISMLDEADNLIAHTMLYIPTKLENIAFLDKIYVRDESKLENVLLGKYSPLQCIYFNMIDFAKDELTPDRELLFNEEVITKQMLEVLKDEQMDYCQKSELEQKSYEKSYDKYEWNNFTRKRNK